MPRKSSLLTPALVGPSAGPFGSMGGIRKPRKAFRRGGKFATGGENDPLAKAVPPVPKAPPSPFTYYSPEAKAARHEGLLQSVTRRNDAEERLKKAYRGLQDSQGATGVPNYKRGGTFKKGSDLPHFFLGDLFGGTPAKTQTTNMQSGSTSGGTNNNIADPAYNQLRDQVLGSASALDFSDPSKYIAGFNADQQNAFQNIRNNQGVYQGNYNQAQGDFNQASAADPTGAGMGYIDKAGSLQTGSNAFNPFAQQASQGANTTVGNYMSPYQQQAMDAVGAASNKAFGAPGGPMERINDTFTGGAAAQFGRERHGDVMGNAVYNQQQALTQQLSQMANTGWQSGLTAATADQNRLASLGQTAGQLANQDIQTQQGLGTAATDITAKGAATNIAAGTAQQALGTARQGAGYTDVNALLSAGNQQQQLEQQQKSLPLQGLQYQQSLGQGWQLPTSSDFANFQNSSSQGSGSQSSPQGSPFGQVVGAGATVLGAMGGGDVRDANAAQNVQPTGQNPYNVTVNPDGTTTTKQAARGGQINPFYFSAGGYVPTVTGVRKRNAMRKPPASPMGPMGGMGGMQPTGMPGMPPQAPPTAGALNPQPQPPQPMPHPANRKYARGGPFDGDAAQDRAMVERGVHQHERQMHKATTGELTKLRLARGGGVPEYKGGGFHDIAGTAGSLLGSLIPIPILGPMIGKFAGHTLANVIGGDTGEIGDDAQRDFTMGIADPDKPGGVGMPNIPGLGGLSSLLGGGGGGANLAGGSITDAGGWGGEGLDALGSGFSFAKGGSTTSGLFSADREALDEDAPEGPFGSRIKIPAIGRSEAKYIPFGPMPVLQALSSSGGGGGGGSDDTMKGLTSLIKGASSLFGGDSPSVTSISPADTMTAYNSMPTDYTNPGFDIDTEIADWSGYAHGGRVPRYAAGSGVMPSSLPDRAALDEKASNGPFGTTWAPMQIGPSTANFGQFGPMPVGGGGGGGGSGGGSGSGETAGGLMGGLGSLLGGVSKIIPLLAEGGTMPGYEGGERLPDYMYDRGRTMHGSWLPGGRSPFLSSSEGLEQRLDPGQMTRTPEMRAALRRSRLQDNIERNEGIEQQARNDLPGYWGDVGWQGLKGVGKGAAMIAGMPGSVKEFLGIPSIFGAPTIESLDKRAEDYFGQPKYAGNEDVMKAGMVLPSMLGVGNTRHVRSGTALFHNLMDALNVQDVFGVSMPGGHR